MAWIECIRELTWIVVQKQVRDGVEEKNSEIKSLNESLNRLVKEKDQIGSWLKSSLSKRMTSDPSSKRSELFSAVEYGSRDVGINFKLNKILGDGKPIVSNKTEKKGCNLIFSKTFISLIGFQ